jgi:AAA domain, putative AbiEii toxin, Type IV TA system/AAA ATPase domain
MRSLRLKNFRSLVDTGRIELRPLTVLVGANSSGKSSFLRFFPLLRQTYEARSASPLLWYGRDVDFGDFSQVVRREADPREIEVELSWSDVEGRVAEATEFELTSTTTLREVEGKTCMTRYRLSTKQSAFVMDFDSSGDLQTFSVFDGNRLVHSLDGTKIESLSAHESLVPRDVDPEWARRLAYEDVARSFTDHDTIQGLVRGLFDGKSDGWPGSLAGRRGGKELREAIETAPSQFARLHALTMTRDLDRRLQYVQSSLDASARCVYIGPFRVPPERFYRLREVAVNHMDPQGENLAVFLRALSADQLDAFSAFTADHIGFRVRLRADGMTVAILLEDDTGQSYNILDMGYGFSQVLPVVAQCWATASGWHPSERDPLPTLVAIEQPELHLHPHYQAKLADMFVGTAHAARAAMTDVRLLIETHSDALVSRLGELVEAGKLASEDVVVLLFEQDPVTKGTTVRQSTFSPDGTLTNWPIGFFAP